MKTTNRYLPHVIALSLLFAISSGARASERLEVNIENNTKLVHVTINSPVSESMDLVLFNDQNRVIYEEKLENVSRFEHSYDLSGYEEGTYTLVLEKENMNYHRVIDVRGSGVTLADSFYTFKPVFKMVDDKLLVHYINNGHREIGISIEHGSETLFENYYGNHEQVFSEVFTVEDLGIGNYTLRFVSQGEFHAFEFEVD